MEDGAASKLTAQQLALRRTLAATAIARVRRAVEKSLFDECLTLAVAQLHADAAAAAVAGAEAQAARAAAAAAAEAALRPGRVVARVLGVGPRLSSSDSDDDSGAALSPVSRPRAATARDLYRRTKAPDGAVELLRRTRGQAPPESPPPPRAEKEPEEETEKQQRVARPRGWPRSLVTFPSKPRAVARVTGGSSSEDGE